MRLLTFLYCQPSEFQMTTENLPTSWKDQLESEARSIARAFRPTTAQISTKSGIMTYMGVPVPNNRMDVVILATIYENNFFESKYDPRNPRNPICFAFGKPEPGSGSRPEMAPHPDISEEFRQATTCDRCEWSKWGSDSESVSGKGKRCKEIYKIGLIPAGDYATNEMAILRVPVTSRKNFEVYVNGTAVQYGRPPWGVVTEVSLKPHMKNQFEVVFTTKNVLPEEELGRVWPKIDGAFEAMMQAYDPNSNPLEKKEPEETGRKRKY